MPRGPPERFASLVERLAVDGCKAALAFLGLLVAPRLHSQAGSVLPISRTGRDRRSSAAGRSCIDASSAYVITTLPSGWIRSSLALMSLLLSFEMLSCKALRINNNQRIPFVASRPRNSDSTASLVAWSLQQVSLPEKLLTLLFSSNSLCHMILSHPP